MPMSDIDVAHLLRRSGFDASPAEVAALAGQELATVVDKVLDTTANPADTRPPALDLPVDQTSQGLAGLRAAWHDRMATTPTPIVEKMTLFWHGHFTTEASDVYRPNSLYEQLAYYRANALGNYRTLAQGMSLLPAMLMYLDNDRNRKQSPNQNFGRELLELYLLGVGNYTEADVIACAAAWTGHSLVNDSASDVAQYLFKAADHDTGNKTFFGTTKNWDGPGIINEILHDNTEKQMITARRIARRIWEFLAYPGVEDNILTDLATLFVANNLEIKPLVRAILNRPEFYSPAAKQGLVRTPTEWAVALLAGSGLTSNAVGLLNLADGMGQTVFNPPNVAGWKNNGYWLTTSALSGRANVAKRVASLMRANNGFDNLYLMAVGDAVDFVAKTFSVYPLADSTRTALMNEFQTERAAPDGSKSRSVTNLLVLVMLSGEMNVG